MYREVHVNKKNRQKCHCGLGRVNSAGKWLMPGMTEEPGSRLNLKGEGKHAND